jgi:enoyl-CoA hydratase
VESKHLSVAAAGEGGAVAVVTLDRPPVNAVSQAMYAEIRDLFGRLDEVLPGVKAVVLTGAGRHFCAGNDLDEFLTLDEINAAGRMRLVRDAFAAIYDCPVPVIGAVRGAALGTGLAGFGSVVQVVDDDQVAAAALALAARMTRHSRTALRHAKESLNAIEFMDLKSGYEFEQRMTGRLVAQADAREAVTTLRERRPPAYRDEVPAGNDPDNATGDTKAPS